VECKNSVFVHRTNLLKSKKRTIIDGFPEIASHVGCGASNAINVHSAWAACSWCVSIGGVIAIVAHAARVFVGHGLLAVFTGLPLLGSTVTVIRYLKEAS
jgi:hypothetical protein